MCYSNVYIKNWKTGLKAICLYFLSCKHCKRKKNNNIVYIYIYMGACARARARVCVYLILFVLSVSNHRAVAK